LAEVFFTRGPITGSIIYPWDINLGCREKVLKVLAHVTVVIEYKGHFDGISISAMQKNGNQPIKDGNI